MSGDPLVPEVPDIATFFLHMVSVSKGGNDSDGYPLVTFVSTGFIVIVTWEIPAWRVSSKPPNCVGESSMKSSSPSQVGATHPSHTNLKGQVPVNAPKLLRSATFPNFFSFCAGQPHTLVFYLFR
jgi:hypothetical protein